MTLPATRQAVTQAPLVSPARDGPEPKEHGRGSIRIEQARVQSFEHRHALPEFTQDQGRCAPSIPAASGTAMPSGFQPANSPARRSNPARNPAGAGACQRFNRNSLGSDTWAVTRNTDAAGLHPSGSWIVSGFGRSAAGRLERQRLLEQGTRHGEPRSVCAACEITGAGHGSGRHGAKQLADTRRPRPPASTRYRQSPAAGSRRIAGAGDGPPP